MGLEVSRLARNSTDWHQLLEICALTDTLIVDEDGLYDPALSFASKFHPPDLAAIRNAGLAARRR